MTPCSVQCLSRATWEILLQIAQILVGSRPSGQRFCPMKISHTGGMTLYPDMSSLYLKNLTLHSWTLQAGFKWKVC